MRLIDVDNIEGCAKYIKTNENFEPYIMIEDLVKLLDNQPTAYDVDKVVEKLEEVGQKMSESKSMQKYGESSPANHRYYKAVSVKRAIEIVNGGGVID